MGAEQIALGTVPVTPAPPVDPLSPVPVDRPVALAAKPIRLIEANQRTVDQLQPVAILGIVAVEAPPLGRAVVQLDILVHVLHLSALVVDLEVCVALRAREDTFLRKGCGWHVEYTGLLVLRRRRHRRQQRLVKIDLREIGGAVGARPAGVLVT
jgi:hypothetical protein